MKRRLIRVIPAGPTVLAELRLDDDGALEIDYFNAGGLRAEWENAGIVTATGVHRPRDGRSFFDALPLVYHRSTTCRVIDVD